MSTDGIIEVDGLSNCFGDSVVHENLDLQVRPGEIIGVVGGSGSGKSVLMRSILALHRPQAGRIRVLGRDALSVNAISREFIEGNTGVLFQNAALFSRNILVFCKYPAITNYYKTKATMKITYKNFMVMKL